MNQDEQRLLAYELFLEFNGYEELAAYTAAVEAKERERCIEKVRSLKWQENYEYGSYGEFDDVEEAIRSIK